MSQKTAIITGITGQDGAYLAKLLLEKNCKVYGTHRRSSSGHTWRLAKLGVDHEIEMLGMELLEFANIQQIIDRVAPDEFYNLAAQSFVHASFEQPLYTSDANAMAVTRILEAIRTVNPQTRFYQASTSEMFGKVQAVPQNEKTPFYPRSPYAVAKLYAHWMTVNYRESYGMFACSGILFNHESPLRGLEFVTRKITHGFAGIKLGLRDALELGNLDAKRDWGFAGDYVEGMWRMLQQQQPDDYVLATGETFSIRFFAEEAAKALGAELVWQGKGTDETGIDRKTGKTWVKINPKFYRPAEVEVLTGDASKARTQLGWKPQVTLPRLIEMMVMADLDYLKAQPQSALKSRAA